MNSSIIATIITVAGSIIVAIIQAVSAVKQAALLRQQVESPPKTTSPKPHPASSQRGEVQEEIALVPRAIVVGKVSNLQVWFWVMGFLVAEAVLVPQIVEPISRINILLIPITTIFLAIFRPIPWGWAATLVAVLHGSNYLGYYLQGGIFGGDDLPISLLLYIGNAIIVAVFAFFRLRKSRTSAI